MDLLLGEHVLGLKARDPDGNVVASPEFSLVLAYDFQIRRQMVRLTNEGTMTDTVIKERYFITPNVYNQLAQRPEFKRKSKGKAKGSGKGFGKAKGMHDRSPDGRQICWKWNSPNDSCRFQCGRLRICVKCFGDHPQHACPGKSDTAGAGGDKDKKPK